MAKDLPDRVFRKAAKIQEEGKSRDEAIAIAASMNRRGELPKHPDKDTTNEHSSTGNLDVKVFDHRRTGEPVETKPSRVKILAMRDKE